MVITRNTYEESDMMTLKIFQRWSHRPGNRPILVPHFVGAIDAYDCTKSKDKSFNDDCYKRSGGFLHKHK